MTDPDLHPMDITEGNTLSIKNDPKKTDPPPVRPKKKYKPKEIAVGPPKTKFNNKSYVIVKMEGKSLVKCDNVPSPEEAKLEDVMVEMKLFVCRVCDQDLKTYFGLRNHVHDQHDPRTYRVCCDRSITIPPSKLYDHIRQHLDKDAFKCQECQREFKSSESMHIHMTRNHNKGSPTNICQVCGKQFWYHHYYEKHLRVHQEIMEKCKYCDKGKVYYYYFTDPEYK